MIFFVLTMFLILSSGVIISFGTSVPSIANQLQGPINCDINGIPAATCTFPQYNPPTPTNVTGPVTQNGQPVQIPWWQCLFSLACVVRSAVGTVGQATGTTGLAQQVWNGFSEVAYGLGYFGTFSFVFFNKLIQAIFLIFGITNIMSTDYSIPFLQYFWLGFFIFYILYGVSMLKPGGSGMQ